jgi:enoyl-CoA hydratase/carnithine racemase
MEQRLEPPETEMQPLNYIEYLLDGAVAVVTMAKSPHNLLDDDLLQQLKAAYGRAIEEKARALILRSSMRHFCAGAELSSFTNGQSTTHADRARWDALMSCLEDVPIPTVASVNGGALGGGLELALTCDMIIAADTAFLGQVEVAVGLIPLLGGTQRLAQRAGIARAKEIAMFGRRHDPVALERWGVLNLVVAESELASATLSWARQLAAGPTVALRAIKIQANEEGRSGVTAADARPIELNDMIWNAEDRKRGFEAFDTTGPATAVYLGN